MVDQGYTTFGYLKMQMVVAHGGRCAEHVIFGEDITDGGRDDLEKITKVNTMAHYMLYQLDRFCTLQDLFQPLDKKIPPKDNNPPLSYPKTQLTLQFYQWQFVIYHFGR